MNITGNINHHAFHGPMLADLRKVLFSLGDLSVSESGMADHQAAGTPPHQWSSTTKGRCHYLLYRRHVPVPGPQGLEQTVVGASPSPSAMDASHSGSGLGSDAGNAKARRLSTHPRPAVWPELPLLRRTKC